MLRRYALAFLGAAWLIVQPWLAADFTGRVMGVIDGDPLEVLHHQRAERIRLTGSSIDCLGKAQAYGIRAKFAVADLAFGKEVTVAPTA
jgi:endonuclease YncB( thermonuclease family)